jgi:hypothetical protein
MLKPALALAIAVMSLASVAKAQDAPASFTLTVTPSDLQAIGKALGTQPYETVAPLMAKLQAQVVEQSKAKAAPVGPPVVSPPTEPQK